MTSPHDALFKRIFQDPENAAGEFRAVLPAGLVEKADWSSLRLWPGSFVDERFRELHTDLLYSVRLQGREAFVYLVMEHQSTSPPLMPLRMLGYAVRVWEDFVRQNPGARKLPAVIPLVMHHGERCWSAPARFIELIDLGEETLRAVEAYLPDFEPVLDDLTLRSEQELLGRAMTAAGRLALFCLKRALHSGDFAREMRLAAGVFREIGKAPGGGAALESVLRYIIEVREDASDWLRQYLVEQAGQEAEEAYMTAAEKLRQEGMLKGLEKGRAEGRVELVLKQLSLRFGPLSESQERRVRQAGIEQLDCWAERVLDAKSLAEVFGER